MGVPIVWGSHILFHRVLRLIRNAGQRTRDIVRDAIDAEVPQVSYQFVNTFDLDLNVHVRSKENGQISLVGNPALAGERLPAVQAVYIAITLCKLDQEGLLESVRKNLVADSLQPI